MTDHAWQWELCVMCGAMIVCPKCGLNTCGGGYGEVDGKPCDVCPLAHAACAKAYEEHQVPRLPGDTLEERRAVLAENRRRLEAQGVQFLTSDDLRDL